MTGTKLDRATLAAALRERFAVHFEEALDETLREVAELPGDLDPEDVYGSMCESALSASNPVAELALYCAATLLEGDE
jgi:hypothetical protein